MHNWLGGGTRTGECSDLRRTGGFWSPMYLASIEIFLKPLYGETGDGKLTPWLLNGQRQVPPNFNGPKQLTGVDILTGLDPLGLM